MSSLSSHHGSVSDRTDWVPIEQAAYALDRSKAHLARSCGELQARGLAKKIKVGRVNKWHISAAYDPRLARRGLELVDGKSTVHELLKHTTGSKRKKAETDAAIVIAFRKWRTTGEGSIDLFRAKMTKLHGRCPGKSQLYDMDRKCPSSDDLIGCIAALIDGRGRPSGEITSCSDAAWQHFCALYLTPKLWSMAKCWRHTRDRADEEGWAWPSIRRVHQLAKERIDPGTIVLKREGEDAWNKKHLSPMQQDPEAWDAGQCWEGDHSTLDFHSRVIRGDKWVRIRPQLTAWLDRRSRVLVGFEITEQGNQFSIRQALVNALNTDGISAPEIVWIDNGKDFMARSIGGLTKQQRRKMTKAEQREHERSASGILGMLGIEPHFARPYNHNGKARVERFFGTVHEDFDKQFDSYTGNKPGMVDAKLRREQQGDIMALPTLDEVREKFEEWASYYNARSEHRIDDLRDPETRRRLSPIEFYTRFLPTMRVVDRGALKLLEPVWSKPLAVHKHGITLTLAGKGVRYGEMEPALEPLVGTDRRVYVSFDPSDTSQVTIYDEEFQLLCTAMENGRYGGLATDKVSLADRKTAFARRKEQKRRAKQRVDLAALSLSDTELASQATRDREIAETKAQLADYDRTRDPNDQPNLRLVRTNIQTTPEEVESQQQRKAAGAEMFDREEIGSLVDAVESIQHNASDQSESLDLSLDDCVYDAHEPDELAYTEDLHAMAIESMNDQEQLPSDELAVLDDDEEDEQLGFSLTEFAHDE